MFLRRVLSLGPCLLSLLVACANGTQPRKEGAAGSDSAGSAGNGSAGDVVKEEDAARATELVLTSQSAPPMPLAVAINGGAPKPVGPRFFGQNFWAWPDEWGDPVAAVEGQTAELGLGLLRAGGIANDAQDEPSPFTRDKVEEFLSYAAAVGAEPLLQIPLLRNSDGTDATADNAAQMVQQTAGRVQLFSLGNEPDLYISNGERAEDFTATEHCAAFRAFATAMREEMPTLTLYGPDTAYDLPWLAEFLYACGDVLDGVTQHRYPLAPAEATRSAAYADRGAYRQWLTELFEVLEAQGVADKPLLITEANITWDGDPAKSTLEASPGTFPAALWLADNIGASLEAGVAGVAYWSLAEGWTLAFFAGTTPRPAFFVLQQFAQSFGDEVLQAVGSPEQVSVFAGRTPSVGLTTAFFVNKSAQPQRLAVTVMGLPRRGVLDVLCPAESLLVVSLPDDDAPLRETLYEASLSAPTLIDGEVQLTAFHPELAEPDP